MYDISDIKASIQSGKLIQDEFFKNATFLKDSRGRLLSYTGGFTVVMPAIVNGEKWAFRCWHTPVKDAKERYTYINRALKNSTLPYFCSFEFEEKGLIVKGESLPTTKMKWVEGLSLKKYICLHYHEAEIIQELANNFLKMILELHSLQMAHGDLQHGNIIVSEEGNLFLIDYDSMYVPEMENRFPDIISGLIDYQHPNRRANKVSCEKLDYFSEAIIYTSLLAISKDPSLVTKYNIEDTEYLLFSSQDYDSFSDSPVYKELKLLADEKIDKCLDVISSYLSLSDINSLEPIENYLFSIDINCPEIAPVNEAFIITWKSFGIKNLSVDEWGELPLCGQQELELSEPKTITFYFTAENGYRSKKAISIEVAPRARINEFYPSKFFTLENIPVKINWDCSNAKKVEILGFGEQEAYGSMIVTQERDTTYTITVKDDFGTSSKSFKIKMLPLPAVKSLFIPVPSLNRSHSISYKSPEFNEIPDVPIIETTFTKIVKPFIPDIKTSGLFVELPPVQRITFFERIKSLIHRITTKIYQQ